MNATAKKIEIFGENDVGKALRSADSLFEELLRIDDQNPSELSRHEVISLIYLTVDCMQKAKDAGWDKDGIRKLLPNAWEAHGRSSFTGHVQDNPKGYPGDCDVVNMIIDRVEKADPHSLGGIIGNYALNCQLAEQHRRKIDVQVELIRETCWRVKSPHIASIACGPSRDLARVQKEISDSGAKVTLIDFDQDAIEDSVRRLSHIKSQVNPRWMDVRKLHRLARLLAEISDEKKFDLVYMGGLFDYLEDKIIKLLLKTFSSDFMQVNGKLMFTNIVEDNFLRTWIDVLGNWDLIGRNEERMRDLLASVKGCKEIDLAHEPMKMAWIAKASY